MTQAEYNAKIQTMQRMWPEGAHRFTQHHDPKTQELYVAYFQVYWDGHWHTLGRQYKPFQPEASYEWWDVLEAELCGAFAGALMHS